MKKATLAEKKRIEMDVKKYKEDYKAAKKKDDEADKETAILQRELAKNPKDKSLKIRLTAA